MKISTPLKTWASLVLIFTFSSVSAQNLLISIGGGPTAEGGGYGLGAWDMMTAEINAAAVSARGSITTTTDLTDLNFMLGFDALWVDQRGHTDRCDPILLSEIEIANIAAFSATGKRVVLIGENACWGDWNDRLMSTVGGTYNDDEFNGITSSVVPHDLTNGVNQVSIPLGGVSIGGTSLFDVNVITLWGNNVVTVLDINVLDDTRWSEEDNSVFAGNLANWIFAVLPTQIAIDVKPNSFPNAVNPTAGGFIAVAILTTSVADGDAVNFDAMQVDPSTITFGPGGAAISRDAKFKDVDNDGDLDMILHFKISETGIACGDTEATLSAQTWSGQDIEGTDSLVTKCK